MTTFEIIKKTISERGYMPINKIHRNTNLFKNMEYFEVLDVVLTLGNMLNTPIEGKYLENATTVSDLICAYQQQSRENLQQDLNLTYQQLRTLVPVRTKQAAHITR